VRNLFPQSLERRLPPPDRRISMAEPGPFHCHTNSRAFVACARSPSPWPAGFTGCDLLRRGIWVSHQLGHVFGLGPVLGSSVSAARPALHICMQASGLQALATAAIPNRRHLCSLIGHYAFGGWLTGLTRTRGPVSTRAPRHPRLHQRASWCISIGIHQVEARTIHRGAALLGRSAGLDPGTVLLEGDGSPRYTCAGEAGRRCVAVPGCWRGCLSLPGGATPLGLALSRRLLVAGQPTVRGISLIALRTIAKLPLAAERRPQALLARLGFVSGTQQQQLVLLGFTAVDG